MAQGRGKSKGAWKQTQTGAAPGTPGAKRKQLFILLFCFLALGGVVDTWISFHAVLDGLKACPSKRKLLVLDVARPIADPRLGVLANDVAARIPEALDKVEDPDRLVLCSCSPGQVSLSSEDVGLSVFGYYFELALRGWADGYNPKSDKDGRVAARA